MKMKIALLLASGICMAASATAAEPPSYEQPPVLSSELVLPPQLRAGPHYRVAEEVENDGFLNIYTLESDFGVFTVRGEDLLRQRIEEVGALAALGEVSKTEAFATAAVEAAKRPIQTAANVVTRPVETVKGIPSGVGRYFKRTSRKIKKASRDAKEFIDEERGKEKEESGGTEDAEGDGEGGGITRAEAQEVATDVAKSYLGVSGVKREWARKLGVDPYSTNETLQRELDRVAGVGSVGSFGVRLATPSLGALDYLGEANDLVWTMNPTDLEVLNLKRLREMGIDKQTAESLLVNRAYSPSRITGLVTALYGTGGGPGRGDLARLANRATSEEEAFFFQRSAELLRAYHGEVAPVRQIVSGEVWGGGITGDGTFVMTLALDYLAWTEDASVAFSGAAERYGRRDGVERMELWLAGRTSPRARKELEARGWKVEEQARERWLK